MCHVCYLSLAVAAEVHATLSQPSSGDIDVVETKIESCLRALRTLDNDDELQAVASKLDRILRFLGIKRRRFFARRTNSISSLFICNSAEELKLLREHFLSGEMKKVLEEMFTVLADEPVNISELKWSTDQYESCLHQFGMFYLV